MFDWEFRVELKNGAFLWRAIQLLLADIRATYTSSGGALDCSQLLKNEVNGSLQLMTLLMHMVSMSVTISRLYI
jgi:hypothetical protein